MLGFIATVVSLTLAFGMQTAPATGIFVAIELHAVQLGNTTEEVDPAELQAAFAEVCPHVAQTVHEKKATWVIRVKYHSPQLRRSPLRNSYSYELFKRGERKAVHSASHKFGSDKQNAHSNARYTAATALMTEACKIVTSKSRK